MRSEEAGAGTILTFEADNSDLPAGLVTSFATAETALAEAADGEDFWVQVADQLEVAVEDLAGTKRPSRTGRARPRY
ncbi:MAG: hypothetical protein H6811_05405 [Phycisphaeraceae bacterium]|nr:hypothetical protein [Phycisphaeraceae bacterium]